MRTVIRISLLASAFALIACSDASGPRTHGGDVIFALGGENNSVVVIDPGAGSVIGHSGPIPAYHLSSVFSSDSARLFFSAADSTGGAIYSLNTTTFALRRVIELSFFDTPTRPDSLRI